jgi:hypothetical protein
MTFLEQQNMLSELLGDPNSSSDDMFPLARRKSALNRGDIQFCSESKCAKDYVSGVVASNQMSVPADFLELYCMVIDNKVIDGNREIDLHQWEEYNTNGIDEPFYYMWEYSGTKTMKFLTNAGVNGKTCELYYFKKQTSALSLDADESIIPDEFCEAPVYHAASWLLKQVGKIELAGTYKQEYGNFVAKAILKSEKEFVKINRPNPEMPDTGIGGGYRQGDGGYRG